MQIAPLYPSKVKFVTYNIRIMDFNGVLLGVNNYSDLKLRSSWFKCFKAARPYMMETDTILYARGLFIIKISAPFLYL